MFVFRNDSTKSDVEGVKLIHLADLPRSLLAMPSKKGALVAAFAQGNTDVLAALLYVVGIRWAGLITHRAWQGLNSLKISPVLVGQLVLHAFFQMKSTIILASSQQSRRSD